MERTILTDIRATTCLLYTSAGFIKIIDALGGIDIDSDAAFTASTDQEYSFTKGMNHMNGAAALAYSRERYAFQEGDQMCIRDRILTTGGVSVGVKDLLPEVIEKLGADLLFHGIDLKPGMPTLSLIHIYMQDTQARRVGQI